MWHWVRFVSDGGPWMLVALAIGVLMGVASLVLCGLAFVRVRVPTSAYLLAAVVTVGVGVLGFGLEVWQAHGYYVPLPESWPAFLAREVALALLPLWVASSLAAPVLSLAALVVATSTRTTRWSGVTTRRGPALRTLVIGLVGAALCAAILLLTPHSPTFADGMSHYYPLVTEGRAWAAPTMCIAAGAAAVALVAGLGSSDDEEATRLAALSARVATLAVAGAAVSALAAWCWNTCQVLLSGAAGTARMYWELGPSFFSFADWLALGPVLGVTVLALASGVALWPARRRLPTRRNIVGLALAAPCVLALAAPISGWVLPGVADVQARFAKARDPYRGVGVPVLGGSPPILYCCDVVSSGVLVAISEDAVQIGGRSVARDAAPLKPMFAEPLQEQRDMHALVGLAEVAVSGRVRLVAAADEPWTEVRPILVAFAEAAAGIEPREVHIVVDAPEVDRSGALSWCWSIDGQGWSPPSDATWQDVVHGLIDRGHGCLELTP